MASVRVVLLLPLVVFLMTVKSFAHPLIEEPITTEFIQPEPLIQEEPVIQKVITVEPLPEAIDSSGTPVNVNVISEKSPSQEAVPSTSSSDRVRFPEMVPASIPDCRQDGAGLAEFSDQVITGLKGYTYQDTTKTMLGFGAEEWLILANKYHLDGLKVMAEKAIGGHLNVGSSLDAFRLAYLYNSPTLKTAALNFIMLNLKEISGTTAIEELAKLSPQGTAELFGHFVNYYSANGCKQGN